MRNVIKPWLPVILWMGVIFSASSDAGNFEHSSRFIVPLLRWLFPTASSDDIGLMHHIIRKAAHFTEYAILALLALRALRLSQSGRSFRSAAVIALLWSVGYAATDEFHQSLVPGRTATATDVLIDIAGAITALAGATLWWRRSQKFLNVSNGPSAPRQARGPEHVERRGGPAI